jgi:hypothetical protein
MRKAMWGIDAVFESMKQASIAGQEDFAELREANVKHLLTAFPDGTRCKQIPNGYCSRSCCLHLPWIIAMTAVGPITFGHRKRVFLIEWKDSLVTDDADTLFPAEDVTKSEKMIHAWGIDKAREYINALLTWSPAFHEK